jgi:hypothetical protein
VSGILCGARRSGPCLRDAVGTGKSGSQQTMRAAGGPRSSGAPADRAIEAGPRERFVRSRTNGRCGEITMRIPVRNCESAESDQRHHRLRFFVRSEGCSLDIARCGSATARSVPEHGSSERRTLALEFWLAAASGMAHNTGRSGRCIVSASEDARSHAPNRAAFRSVYFFRLSKGSTFGKVACSSNTLIYTP